MPDAPKTWRFLDPLGMLLGVGALAFGIFSLFSMLATLVGALFTLGGSLLLSFPSLLVAGLCLGFGTWVLTRSPQWFSHDPNAKLLRTWTGVVVRFGEQRISLDALTGVMLVDHLATVQQTGDVQQIKRRLPRVRLSFESAPDQVLAVRFGQSEVFARELAERCTVPYSDQRSSR